MLSYISVTKMLRKYVAEPLLSILILYESVSEKIPETSSGTRLVD
jgi:hypothetical protein